MKFVNDNGGILSVLGVAIVVFGFVAKEYTAWKIEKAVAAKFVAAGVVAPHRVASVESDIDELRANDEKLDNKIERIVGILLEE